MKKISIFILGMLFLSLQGKAQWTQLSNPLLQGANLQQLVQTSNGVFAITSGGLFETTNQGTSWNYIADIDSTSNNPQNFAIMNNNIYIQKSNSSTLLEYNNGSWAELASHGIPNNGGSWGLGGANNKLFTFFSSNDSNYIYYSNNGSNWSKGVYLGSQNGNINFSYLNNFKQYFYFNDTLYYTSDGLSKTTVPFPSGVSANDFSNDNVNGELNGKYIYYSNNDGSNKVVYRLNTNSMPLQWVNITSNITSVNGAFIPNIAISDSAIFTGVLTQTLSLVSFLRSTDHGNTFESIPIAGCGLYLPVLEQVISISSDNLIAQDASSNLFYSNDNGTTWTVRDNGLLAMPSGNLVNSNGILYNSAVAYGGGPENIIKSADNGNTWTVFDDGLPQVTFSGNESFAFIDDLFNLNNTPYVIAENMTNANNSPVLVYTLNTGNNQWVETATQPGPYHKSFQHLGNNNNTFFVIYNHGNNVDSIWRTPDGGQTWDDITSTISGFNLNQVYSVNGKGETDTLFLFGQNNNGNDEIFLSVNNGSKWFSFQTFNNGNSIKLDNNNNNNGSQGLAVCNFGGTNNTFIIVITQWNNNNNSDWLYALKNGSLVQLNTTGLPENLHVNSIKYMNGNWYLGTTVGVYISANGTKWSQIKNNSNYYLGMQTQQIYDIGGEMFIGTNDGIWKTDLNVGINEPIVQSSKLKVYPNPVNNILNIEQRTTNNGQLTTNIDIYSGVGEKVFSATTGDNNIKIDFSGFSKGIYLVRIMNGKELYTYKIIK